MVASTPGLAEVLAGDWRRAAGFYVRYGIAEVMLRRGANDLDIESGGSSPSQHASRSNATKEGSGSCGIMGVNADPTGASIQSQPAGTV